MFGVQFSGLNNFKKSISSFEKSAQESARKRSTIAALEVESNAKKLIQAQSSGKTEVRNTRGNRRVVTVSAPGDAPNTDTGRLVSSIRTRFEKAKLSSFVFTKLKYAFFLEFGTSTMKARPFLIPALKKYLENAKKRNWKI